MDLTEDSFRALARSSPWRWRTLHLTHTGGRSGRVEAWIRRPGEMVVDDGRGTRVDRETDPTAGWAALSFAAPGLAPTPPPAPRRWALEVTPELRPDGLVAVRPDDGSLAYDDPMYESYTWVAMLDPVELSAGTALDDLAAGDRDGRATWWATAVAEEEYEPRCGCCPLLWGAVSERHEAADGGPTYAEHHPDPAYPDAWRVGLDVQTGVLVSLAPLGYDGDRTDLGLELRLRAVDADLDAVFTRAESDGLR